MINNEFLFSGDAPKYKIERSIRFNSVSNSLLTRQTTVVGDRKKWTWAGWIKTTENPGQVPTVIFQSTESLDAYTGVGIFPSGKISFYNEISGQTAGYLQTSNTYRDHSAWMHVCFVWDSQNASLSNRMRVDINGKRVTNFEINIPPNGEDSGMNSATSDNAIGGDGLGTYSSFYLSDVYFIDGQALDSSSFGEFDANDIWQPKSYSGDYGTNGYHLPFSDNSTPSALGTDVSPNGNTWSVSNLSVTADADNGSLIDTPTNYGIDTGIGGEVRGNYATWNPLVSTDTITNGMLDVTGVANYNKSTIGMTSGKWYCEYRINSASVNFGPIWGFINSDNTIYGGLRAAASQYVIVGAGTSASVFNHTINLTSGIIGIALDLDNGTCNIYHEDILKFSAVIPLGQTYFFMFYGDFVGSTPANDSVSANFGQYTFTYPAPIGHKALCTTNLPSQIITNPSTAMDVLLYTGNESVNVITGLKFKPDLVWIKNRSTTTDHKLVDSLRGRNRELESNTPDPEFLNNFGLTEFNEDGFDINSDPEYNGLNQSHVAWCWDTNTLATNNTQGSVASVVKTNQNAGFSIVRYTGNLNSSGIATVGHGLGIPPKMVITKSIDFTSNWVVQHASLSDPNRIMLLNSTSGEFSPTFPINSPTSTTFSTSFRDGLNELGKEFIAYCFAPVVGYSDFGYYIGTGTTVGPVVYTGMRPRFLLIKSTTAGIWYLYDSVRSPNNPVRSLLTIDPGPEPAPSNYIDFLSNGFRILVSNSSINIAAQKYIYVAFAESPFKYSRAV